MKEKNLIIRFKNGDKEAFGTLYNNYYDMLYAYVYKRTLRKEFTEDVISETFMTVLNKINTFDWKHKNGFKSWIFRICINTINSKYKENNKVLLSNGDEGLLDTLEHQENEILLTRSLNKLSKVIYIDIITLYYWEGYKLGEIAEILNKNTNTVRVYIKRAREELSKILNLEK